jgi:hypothetical protein
VALNRWLPDLASSGPPARGWEGNTRWPCTWWSGGKEAGERGGGLTVGGPGLAFVFRPCPGV